MPSGAGMGRPGRIRPSPRAAFPFSRTKPGGWRRTGARSGSPGLRTKSPSFWLLGLGDQIAFLLGRHRYRGLDDLPGTLARVTDDAPAILLAHEPDIFPQVPTRVSLTLSGHTHGGQVRLLGWSPMVPSDYGNRYAYGHVVESGRHLIVSGGLGTVSAGLLPVRLGVPPEIVLVELGGRPVI